jgi:ABC-type uncharacterized transport system involved in gliding motility auxiliary subunit
MNMREIFKSQAVRYGGYASLMTVLGIAVIVIINLVVGQIPAQIDLTENRLFTLSDQTYATLDALEEDVTLYALYRRGGERRNVMEILRRYDDASSRIRVEVVDPDRNPTFAERFGEGEELNLGSVVVAGAGRSRVIPQNDLLSYSSRFRQVAGINVEREVTNAIAFLQTENVPVVYELAGHQELTLGELNFEQRVEEENYRVESLNLVTEPGVPEDAAILLVLGPQTDISEDEADKIQTFLDDGGSALFMVDYGSGETPVLNSMLEVYGLRFQRGVIVEQREDFHTGNGVQLVPEIREHPVTDPLSENRLLTIIPAAQPVEITEVRRRDLEVQPLFTTSDQAYLRRNLESGSLRREPEDTDGPFHVAAASSARGGSQDEQTLRIVAVGSSGLLAPAGNMGLMQGNVELFRNSLAWLQNRGELISLSPKSTLEFPMQLTGVQRLIYTGVVVILIPLLAFAGGIVVWLRRRHK